jgi:transcriptional regulator with XRE-family HTH domain
VGEIRDVDRSMELAEQIRLWRVQCELTQSQLESRAGLAHNAISRIENGVVTPRLETLERIAKALEIGIEELQFRVPMRVADAGVEEADTSVLVDRLRQLPKKRRRVVVAALVNLLDQLGSDHE